VILGADFTGDVGHFVVIIGYNDQGFVVNDSAGKWDQASFSPADGYAGRRCSEGVSGAGVVYSYRAVVRAFNKGKGEDGTAWVVYLRKP
jgi:hypothetical protein